MLIELILKIHFQKLHSAFFDNYKNEEFENYTYIPQKILETIKNFH